jgi:hypothetical protein
MDRDYFVWSCDAVIIRTFGCVVPRGTRILVRTNPALKGGAISFRLLRRL